MRIHIDLTGKKFGNILIMKRVENINSRPHYLCKCDCGIEKIIQGNALYSGRIISCGCSKSLRLSTLKYSRTHGMCGTSEYIIWRGIKIRCLNKKNKDYHNYGGRGITICDEWKDSFEQFYKDMGPRPSKKHSIERINNNGPYSKDNCKWLPKLEQQSNKRTNIYYTHNGITKTASQWSNLLGGNRHLVKKRINKLGICDEVFTKKCKHRVFYSYKGLSKTISDWNVFLGRHKYHITLMSRIGRGWTIKEAIETPLKKRKYE